MKTSLTLPVVLLAFILSGCSGLRPGSDPIVVNAERVTGVALDVFDSFLRLEYENRVFLEKLDPGIHKAAEKVRYEAPKWIESAVNLTRSYKRNRTPENKFNLITAMAVLEAGMQESQRYIRSIKQK